MHVNTTGTQASLTQFFVTFFLLLAMAPASADQLDAPVPRVSGTVVFWDSVPGANSYNIHSADGTYVSSSSQLQFNVLDFFSLDRGGYLDRSFFIVSTNDQGWENWGKSAEFRVAFSASCLGCVSSAPPESPVSELTFSGPIKLETYENECFHPSIQPSEMQDVAPCQAVCVSGGSAVGGACFVDARESSSLGGPEVRLGTSTKIGQSTFQCFLSSTHPTSLTVTTTVVAKCLSTGH